MKAPHPQSSTHNQEVVLVKLGGSLITDKRQTRTALPAVITDCLQQIKSALEQAPQLRVIIAHGQGSFAHRPAKKYALQHGFIDESSTLGYALTQYEVVQLNQIVINAGLQIQMPVVPFFPSNAVLLADGKEQQFDITVLEQALLSGFMPVSTGDVVLDTNKGCGIWSADTVLPAIARKLQKRRWRVREIIHVTQTPGVYADMQKIELGILPEISSQNISAIQQQLGAAAGVDVTGGMKEKVLSCIDSAKFGIPSIILNAADHNIYNELVHQQGHGTRIRA